MESSLSKCSTTGKTRFSTPGDAKEAIIKIKAKNKIYDANTKKRQKRRLGKPDQCRSYFCPRCKGFHLTSRAAPPRQKKIEKNFQQRIRNTSYLVITEQEAGDWKADSLPFPNP